MKYQNLSILFEEKPDQFGTRGDPYFWEYLQDFVKLHTEINTIDELTNAIKQQFEEISGERLTIDALPYVERFAHGGMSSGVLCGKFWLNKAIPLLVERFSALDNK